MTVDQSEYLISPSTPIHNTSTDMTESNKPNLPENYQIILLSFAYGMISLLALVGNSSIIYIVIRNRRMHSVTNYFICNLALADCLVACFAIPFQVRFFFHLLILNNTYRSFPLVPSCCFAKVGFAPFSL